MGKDEKDDLGAVRALVDALTPFDSAEQERIIRWAREKLGLSATLPSTLNFPTPPPKPAVVTELYTPDDSMGKKQTRDIKSFIAEKDPKSDRQLAAVVAYYYAFEAPENQRKTSINATDIIEACRLAQKRRPKKPAQTLVNAAQSGFLDRAEESGQYKLNAVGENLVAMALPDGVLGRRATKRPIAVKKKSKKVATKKSK